jgi:CheY-like chemotaxis protein
MPEGGSLTIATANAELDARFPETPGEALQPGRYVALRTTDTGTGMSPEVQARVFEPFFTTKPIGQGTGLGLSMLYGFVRQSGGQVRLNSAPGLGTTVCLYLPCHDGTAEEERDAARAGMHASLDAAGPPAARETLLLVEDEPALRSIVTESLRDLGYRVIVAPDGPAALRLLQPRSPVDLLLTDVGLPGGMNGRQLAEAARERIPGLRVLFITGYAHNAAPDGGTLLLPGMEMMPKPFGLDELAARIRAILGPA